MAKASPAITSFNAGEFSPLMAARSDLKYYTNACKRLSNFVPTVQGPVRNRPGTKFAREIKDSTSRTWLRRFIFSKTQAYIIEFGHLYARFYTNRGTIMAGATPYEIATPFTAASLTRSDGTFRLRFTQTGDVLYIASDGQFPVQKMIRLTTTTFSIAALETTGGPFLDINPDNPIVMYASAATGAINITANAAIFTAARVGSLIFIEQKKADGIAAWEPGKAIALAGVRRSDGKNYQALNAATTGGVKPIHSSGSRFDGVPAPNALQLVKGGQVVALVVCTATRAAVLPQVSTIAEAGIAGFRFDPWFGVLTQAAVPAAVRAKLIAASTTALAAPDLRTRFATIGAEISPLPGERFDAYIQAEIAKFRYIAASAGIEAS